MFIFLVIVLAICILGAVASALPAFGIVGNTSSYTNVEKFVTILPFVIWTLIVILLLGIIIIMQRKAKLVQQTKDIEADKQKEELKNIIQELEDRLKKDFSILNDQVSSGTEKDKLIEEKVTYVDTTIKQVDTGVQQIDNNVKVVDNSVRDLEDKLQRSNEEISDLQRKMNDLLQLEINKLSQELKGENKETHTKLDSIIDVAVEQKSMEDKFAVHALNLKNTAKEIDRKTQELNRVIAERNSLSKQKAEFKRIAQQLIDDISVQDDSLNKDYYTVFNPLENHTYDKEFGKVNIIETNTIPQEQTQLDDAAVDDIIDGAEENIESDDLMEELVQDSESESIEDTSDEDVYDNDDLSEDSIEEDEVELDTESDEEIESSEDTADSIKTLEDSEEDSDPKPSSEEYIIRFDKQGGLGGADTITTTLYESLSFITTPLKPGYEFVGYFDRFDGKGKKYFDSEGFGCNIWDKDCDATLFAYWILVPYSKFMDSSKKLNNSNVDDILKLFDNRY